MWQIQMILWPLHALNRGRGFLLPWVPFMMGVAIALWFSCMVEPSPASYLIAAGAFALCVVLWRFAHELIKPVAIAGLCLALGWLACGFRLWAAEAPVLDFRFYGGMMGRVVAIDRSQSDAIRITLDQVWMERTAPERTPNRVRVSLRSKDPGHEPFPGEFVALTASLAAPQGPVEPGTFDFRRMAYFEELGALGYSVTPVVLWQDAAPYARMIDRMRRYLSGAMMAHMPSQAGAFATGAMTGDRSWLRQETAQALRDSSLAHLLAISGQNLAFLIAFVFGLIRYGLALIPYIALRVNTKKVAAFVSFFVAAFYLALSGSNVATERAFIMVTVMLGAVLFDRQAITLRSIALAAILILMWKPESLLDPGFQMSFAATAALIAGFRAMDQHFSGVMPKWAVPIFALFLASLIGGLSTAPYAAAHFNRYADYGLIANLLTGPVMGLLVMPMGAIAALLAPFGAAAPALWGMEQGAAWILFIAHCTAGLDGAVTHIPAPDAASLPLITLGGALMIFLMGRWRLVGLTPMLCGAVLWGTATRPPLLISADGALVGLIGAQGRVLSAAKGAGFVAQNWLANDGDAATQVQAALRAGMTGDEGLRYFTLNFVRGAAIKGKKNLSRLTETCAKVDFVVVVAALESPPKGCVVFDQNKLAMSGALALYPEGKGVLRIRPTENAQRQWRIAVPPDDFPQTIIAR